MTITRLEDIVNNPGSELLATRLEHRAATGLLQQDSESFSRGTGRTLTADDHDALVEQLIGIRARLASFLAADPSLRIDSDPGY